MTATCYSYRPEKIREVVKRVYFGWSIRGIAQVGNGGVDFLTTDWQPKFRTPRPLGELTELVDKGATHIALEVVSPDGRTAYPDYAVSEFAKPFRWEPNDCLQVNVNQGNRQAFVLAVIGDEALIEYEMPRGTTALWVINANNSNPIKVRNLSYKNCPRKWLDAMDEAGTGWEGNGQ